MTTSLDDVARAFRGSIPADGRLWLTRIDGLDRLGIPVVQAAWLGPDGTAVTSYGYGESEIEAQVGALGELCEELHVGVWMNLAERRLASRSALVAEGGEACALDPLTLCLPAGSAYTLSTELSWVLGKNWPDGAPVYVPGEWVAAHPYQLGGTATLITPITNGLGAGFDMEHAIAHGVMELLQRDGNVTSYRALDRGVVVDLPQGCLPGVDELLMRLREAGLRPMIKLAGQEFGLANLYVVGDDAGTADFSLQVSACGEACHPDAGRGVRKALLEFVGSRARKAATHGPVARARGVLPAAYLEARLAQAGQAEERRALDAMITWLEQSQEGLRSLLQDTAFLVRSHVAFADLPSVGVNAVANSQARLALLQHRLAQAGLGIIVVDCSPPGGHVHVVRVIVPGLESETMSYHRIGWRGVARLRAERSPLVLDAPAEGALPVRLRRQDEARCGGPAWLSTARVAEATRRLYPLYRECGAFSAQLQAAAAN